MEWEVSRPKGADPILGSESSITPSATRPTPRPHGSKFRNAGWSPRHRERGSHRACEPRATADGQPSRVEISRCSDLPHRGLKRSTLELSVWIQLGVAPDRLYARTGMSAREASLSASVGHAHVQHLAKPSRVRSRGWIPDHQHRCRSLTAGAGAVLVDRKHRRLRRPIVREALEV